MSDSLYLIPLGVAAFLLIGGFRLSGRGENRLVIGMASIGFSLMLWLSSAMLLSSQGKFYFTLDFSMIVFLLGGLACLMPRPPGATRANQHTTLGKIMIWLGIVTGLTHAIGMLIFPVWSACLLDLYSHLGFRGAFIPIK